MAEEPTQEQDQEAIRKRVLCARCGVIRTDGVDSDICGSCADDLRMEEQSGEANSNTRAD